MSNHHSKENMVLVFTKPACPQCDAVKKWFDKHPDVPVEYAPIDDNVLAQAVADGVQQAPIVVLVKDGLREHAHGGFNRLRLMEYRKALLS
jgi:glutaredoxin